MALNQRQKLAYKHLCNLWRRSITINATTGVVSDETYSLAYSGVQMRYQFTDNISDPTEGVGRIKRPTIFTTDILYFDAAQEVGEDWIVKNVTILPNGQRSVQYGTFHRILGAPRIVENAGNRRANQQIVMAMSCEKVPAGVS